MGATNFLRFEVRVLDVCIMGDNNFLRFLARLEMCHWHISRETIALIIQFKGNFFREKVSLIPFKNRFVKSVPLSADSGSGLCPETLQAFEKA